MQALQKGRQHQKHKQSLFNSSVLNCETQNICLTYVNVTVYGRRRTEHSAVIGYSKEYTIHFILFKLYIFYLAETVS